MEFKKRRIVALALLCVLLVKCQQTVEATEPAKETLPSLILDEQEPIISSSSPKQETNKPTEKETFSTTGEPELVKRVEEKLVPYETNKEEKGSTNKEQPREEEESGEKKATSQPVTTVEPSTNEKAPEEKKQIENNAERDINVLLANKDDAENDLALSVPELNGNGQAGERPAASKPADSSSEKKSDGQDLDAPVETNKPESGDRFHYNLAPSTERPVETETTTTARPADSSPTSTPVAEAPAKPEVLDEKPATAEGTNPQREAPKQEEATLDAKKDVPSADDKTIIITDEKKKPTEQPTTAQPIVSESSSSSSSTESAKPSESSTVISTTEKEKEQTTTVPTSQTKPADKPAASVPSIIAVALGSALGAAVNPIQAAGSKEKSPVPPVGAASTTTTKAPSTVRKSTTDKWDRWTPSTSSTSAPPTRRRPILPSIRRRFRPYNRFSPFPWGGADSYSPAGSSDPDFRPEFGLRPTTYRPRRRNSTDSTKTSATPSEEEAEDEVDETTPSTSRRRGGGNKRRHHHHHHRHDSDFEPSGKRRHHNHVGNPNRRQHFEPKDEQPSLFGGSSSPFDSFGAHPQQPRPISPGFGLFNTGSATGSGFDLMNPFSGWLDDIGLGNKPASSRPPHQSIPSVVGTPGRIPGHKPVAVDGEFNDHTPGHEEHHPHRGHEPHGHNHGHGRDRDEYDHDHHHDHYHEHCRDQDYDHDHHEHHREPYRPNRPNRPPYRPINGDYDTNYPPSRPGRPYNRRDQAEIEQGAREPDKPASPSLYASSKPSRSSESAAPSSAGPRRPSIFSPFDALFGGLDDELFSLRSSFMEPQRLDSTRTFDAVITSPKISMPPALAPTGKESSFSSASNDSEKKQEATTNERQVNNGKTILADDLPSSKDETIRSPRSQDPCSMLSKGFLCFFVQKQPSVFDIFRL